MYFMFSVMFILLHGSLLVAQNCSWQDSPIGSLATGYAAYDVCDPVSVDITTTAYSYSTTADEQYFVFRELCGDGELIVELNGLVPSTGRYGIEFRSGTEPGGMKFGLKKSGTGNSLTKMSRTTIDGAASITTVVKPFVHWLKITRVGDQFIAYTSLSGSSWSQVYAVTISMDECIVGGMLAHGPNIATSVSGSFDNISFVGDGGLSELLFCGWKTRSTPVDSSSVEFADRFGNLYTREEITISKDYSSQSNGEKSFSGCDCAEFGINPGYFDLWFEDCEYTTTGFNDPVLGEDRRKVACQVFAEIAQTIELASVGGCDYDPDRKVNIRFIPSEQVGGISGPVLDLGILGESSPIYLEIKERQDGLPWRIINSGELQNDWEHLYHGEIRLNFEPGAGTWWANSTSPPPPTEIDLYSVLWHEAIHTLGFVSQAITENFYTRFDKFLFLNYTNGNSFSLITVDGFDWNYSAGVDPATDFYSGCQDPLILGPDFEFQSNTGGLYPVLANDQTQLLEDNSHSHLNINCDGQPTANFLMHPNIPTGIRRTITNEELDILCSLGYTINSTLNGNNYSCGCTVAGAEDFGPDCNSLYQVSLCETLSINAVDLLDNDNLNIDPAHPELPDIVFLDVRNPAFGNVVDNQDDTYTFTPTVLGQVVLAYIPVGCDGIEGNLTNIYIEVIADPTCAETYNCNDFIPCEGLGYQSCQVFDNCEELSPCNLICNPGFCGTVYRDRANLNTFIDGTLFNFPYDDIQRRNNSIIPNWIRTHGSPDINGINQNDLTAHLGSLPITETPSGVQTGPGLSEGIMTTVSMEEGDYFLCFDYFLSSNGLAPSFHVELIEATQLHIPAEVNVFADYPATAPIENLFTIETTTPNFTKGGTCFNIEENNVFDALWFYLALNDSEAGVHLDNVELILDDFELGENPDPILCGNSTQIGSDFCMLSEVGINYEWVEVATNTTILEYTVLDGNVIGTVNNPNSLPFNTDTRVLTVSPLTTTTYRLIRSIDPLNAGGLPNLFVQGCPVTEDEITVVVEENLPDASFIITDLDCIYSFFPNPFNVGPEFTHYWDLGNGTTSTDAYPPSTTYSAGTTYQVSHTVTGECGTSTETLPITIPEPFAEFSFIDDCLEVHFMSVDSDLDIYAWDFGDGVGVSSEANPVYNYLLEGTYIVELTVTDECGNTATFSLDVKVEDCSSICDCDDSFDIVDGGSGVLLSTLIQPNGNFPLNEINDECISIVGNLIVDTDYIIKGGEIMMNPGASITLVNEARLELENITEGGGIHGCGVMWRGITVGVSATLVMNGCRIEDARYAIEPLNKSEIYITDNIFNNNFVGLYSNDPGGASSFTMGPFSGNRFSATGLSAPFQFQTPVPGELPFAGIQFIEGDITSGSDKRIIGVLGANPNTFERLRNGIVLEGSINATVINSTFRDHRKDNAEPIASYPMQGFGIHFEGGTNAKLYQRPPTVPGTSFFNCNTAIRSVNTLADIHHNKIRNVNTGIQVESVTLDEIDIVNNDIHCITYGINLLHNDDALNLLVFHNTIQLGEFGDELKGTAINIMETGNRNEDNLAAITRNIINLHGNGGIDGFGSRGIAINSVNELEVLQNVIFCEALFSGNIGILYSDGYDNSITENQVYGTGSVINSNAMKTGMRIEDCTQTNYNCNYFDRLHTGIIFRSGTATDTELRTTVFQPPFFNALHYEDDLTINAQNWNGNKWRGTAADYGNGFDGFAALNEVEADPGEDILDLIAVQRYLIQEQGNGYLPPSIDLPNFSGSGQPWFLIDTDVIGTVASCNQPWYPLIPEIKEIDKTVAEGLNLTGTYADVLTWEAERGLFEKLKNGSLDLTSHPEVQTFYNNSTYAMVGRFDYVKEEQKSIYAQEVGFQIQLGTLHQEQKDLRNQILSIDSLLVINPSTALWSQRDSLLLLLKDKGIEAQVLFDQIFASRISKTNATLTANQNLSTTELMYQNEVMFNDIYMNTLSMGNPNFNATMITNIFAVASQCPLEGGRVVYRARSLYALIDPSFSFEKSCLPGSQLGIKEGGSNAPLMNEVDKHNGNQDFAKSIFIYPNPANDELTIEYNLKEDGQLLVFSSIGHILKENILSMDQSSIKLNTSNWKEGIYFIKIHSGDQELFSDKIIIIH